MSEAPSPWTRPSAIRPGRLSCAGTVSRWPASSTGASSGPASTHVSPRSRTGTPASASSAGDVGGERAPRRATRRGCRSARASARRAGPEVHGPHNSLQAPVRYCGVDISAKPGNQQLVHAARAARGRRRRRARRHVLRAGTVEQVARTIEGFGAGRPSWPSTRRRARAATCSRAGAPLRAALGLPEGRYERMRVCDALLFRRGLPLYPVPAAGQPPQGVGAVDRRRLRAVRRARRARRLPARRRRR